jgi:hypothetical protein
MHGIRLPVHDQIARTRRETQRRHQQRCRHMLGLAQHEREAAALGERLSRFTNRARAGGSGERALAQANVTSPAPLEVRRHRNPARLDLACQPAKLAPHGSRHLRTEAAERDAAVPQVEHHVTTRAERAPAKCDGHVVDGHVEPLDNARQNERAQVRLVDVDADAPGPARWAAFSAWTPHAPATSKITPVPCASWAWAACAHSVPWTKSSV